MQTFGVILAILAAFNLLAYRWMGKQESKVKLTGDAEFFGFFALLTPFATLAIVYILGSNKAKKR